ncbi:MAG: hypothetical protein ACAF41_13790 [Leptolyngbya sp. BL-A-14]
MAIKREDLYTLNVDIGVNVKELESGSGEWGVGSGEWGKSFEF